MSAKTLAARVDLLENLVRQALSRNAAAGPAETQYWQAQAALLDPAAHIYTQAAAAGPVITRTVPAGTTWYARNLWWVLANDPLSGPFPSKFHRSAAIEEAIPMASGTNIVLNGTILPNTPFSYICQPELVIATDTRYTSNPQALYYERLMRLGQIPQFDIGFGGGPAIRTFPTDFASGLVLSVNAHDSLYVYMNDPSGRAVNLQGELSDFLIQPIGVDGSVVTGIAGINTADGGAYNKVRFTRTVLMPWKQSDFTRAQIGSGEGEAGAPFVGSLTYVKLPPDW
jgi:hypothetical protein